MLNIGLKNIYFCLNKSEFLELKKLLSLKNKFTIAGTLLEFNIIYN